MKRIPKEERQELIDRYTLRFYKDKNCERCEYFEDRHCDICDSCASYSGGAQLAYPIEYKEQKYMAFPAGDLKGVITSLRKVDVLTDVQLPKVIEKHPTGDRVAFHRRIKFTGELRDYQGPAVKVLIKSKRGILKSPPRSGKTVMASAVVCKLGKKTIILASQLEWLIGFYETFCGEYDKHDELLTEAMTNARGSGLLGTDERKRKLKKPKRYDIGFCKTLDDFERHSVCLSTYQTFLSKKGKALLKKIKNKFGVLIVDEVQTTGAEKYSSILSNFNTEYRLGLSGTPTRKDTRDKLIYKIIGPVIHEVKVKRLKAEVRLVRTDYSYKGKGSHWSYMVNNLEYNPKRLKLIAQTAIKDIKDGHMVLIPMQRVRASKALAMAINQMSGKKWAVPFIGGGNKKVRKEIIEKARRYKIKCIVGTTKLISVGVNIPRASAIYEAVLSSNKENCEQRVSRILTPYEDKPRPLIRYFLDDMQARKSCLRNEFWQCVWPTFKPVFHNDDFKVFQNYLKTGARKKASSEGRDLWSF